MSDKVTPQRVAAIKESMSGRTVSDGSDTQKIFELLAFIEQQSAPAPVETVGWKTEYECLSAHDKWYPVTVLVEDSAIKRFIEARESEKSITRNISEPIPLVRRSDHITALAVLKAEVEKYKTLLSQGVIMEPREETAAPKVAPTMGRIVMYKLTASDVEEITRRRTTAEAIKERMALTVTPEGDHAIGEVISAWPKGAQAHIGNQVFEGHEHPAIVVAVWGADCINLQVMLDGNDVFWALSRQSGDNNGQWHWPTRS